MKQKLVVMITSFMIFTLITWGFDIEGGRYLQQIALGMAGFMFGNLLTLIALESSDDK